VLILVRHGRTAANAAGLLQGRTDNPLDRIGLLQAEAIAGAIGHVDRLISSPLKRALETAAAFGTDTDVDDRFAELDFGELESVAISEVAPEIWSEWQSSIDYRPPGGETIRELGVRVREALSELVEDAAGTDIVVISHVSPIKAGAAWALGAGDDVGWRTHLGQASISRIIMRNGVPMLLSFNETAHLDRID